MAVNKRESKPLKLQVHRQGVGLTRAQCFDLCVSCHAGCDSNFTSTNSKHISILIPTVFEVQFQFTIPVTYNCDASGIWMGLTSKTVGIRTDNMYLELVEVKLESQPAWQDTQRSKRWALVKFLTSVLCFTPSVVCWSKYSVLQQVLCVNTLGQT